MAAGATYTTIATTTTTGTASIDWQSISGAYTDLILIGIGNDSGGFVKITLNNDTSSNYSRTALRGNGTSASSARASNETAWYPDFETNPSTMICHFMNYSNATTYKTMLGRFNNTTGIVVAQANLWRSTAAINRITLSSSAGGSTLVGTFSLYGITAA